MGIDRRILNRFALAAAPLLFALQTSFNYPGNYTFDSEDQLHQAMTGLFNDWHPPLMAYFWRALIALTGAPGSIFVLQSACYWAAFGLLSDGLIRAGRLKTGILVLLSGLFPVFLYINGLVIKDSEMGAAFLAAFALIFWFKVQGRRVPPVWAVVSALLLTYGVLVRANSVFALGPLLIYYFSNTRTVNHGKTIIITVLAALVAIVLSAQFNTLIPGVTKTQPIRSLQIFDLVGIAKFSGDVSALDTIQPLTIADVDRCYTAYWWDSVAPWGTCPAFSSNFMNKDYKLILSERDVYPLSAKLTPLWLGAIRHHPLAYAEHRLKHFNAEINFIVPSLVRRYGKTFFSGSAQEIRQDYIKKNFVTWPVTWYGVALLILVALRRSAQDASTYAASLLVASGLTYGLAYLIIGVASDSRYMYWTILSCCLGLLLAARQIWQRLVARDGPTLAACLAIIAIVVVGMVARCYDYAALLV